MKKEFSFWNFTRPPSSGGRGGGGWSCRHDDRRRCRQSRPSGRWSDTWRIDKWIFIVFLFFHVVVVVDDVVLFIGASGGWKETVTGLESVVRVIRRIGRIKLDQQRWGRRPNFGVMDHSAQVSNHRRLDVAAVVDFNAIFTPQATNIQENGSATSSDERKKLIRIDPSILKNKGIKFIIKY